MTVVKTVLLSLHNKSFEPYHHCGIIPVTSEQFSYQVFLWLTTCCNSHCRLSMFDGGKLRLFSYGHYLYLIDCFGLLITNGATLGATLTGAVWFCVILFLPLLLSGMSLKWAFFLYAKVIPWLIVFMKWLSDLEKWVMHSLMEIMNRMFGKMEIKTFFSGIKLVFPCVYWADKKFKFQLHCNNKITCTECLKWKGRIKTATLTMHSSYMYLKEDD